MGLDDPVLFRGSVNHIATPLSIVVIDALVFLGLLTLFLKVPFPSMFYPCIFYLQVREGGREGGSAILLSNVCPISQRNFDLFPCRFCLI